MSFIITAFYTEDTPYEQEVQHLRSSLEALQLKHDIRPYKNRGEWVINAGIKPEHIYNIMLAYPTDNIVYVDADAVVRQYPTLFNDIEEDIGVHYYKGKELLSGTIFFKNTPRVLKLLEDWIYAQTKNERTWDQKIFQQLLVDNPDIKIRDLP